MAEKRISSRLRVILHSLATKVPKIVLYRVEHIFPALNTSMVSVLFSVYNVVPYGEVSL
jgi:hypothetical protein